MHKYNGRTELNSTEVFYCKKCNTPLFDNTCSICGSNCEKLGTDLQAVFAEDAVVLFLKQLQSLERIKKYYFDIDDADCEKQKEEK